MNKIITSSALFVAAYMTSASAAYNAPIYANAIAAHNIAVIQHSIFSAANAGFDSIGVHVGTTPGAAPTSAPAKAKDYTKIYGTMPMYGSMSMYGEYGDDGTVFNSGRSGGDNTLPLMMWATWNHDADDEKFSHLHSIDTKSDLIMAGLGATRMRIAAGDVTFGGFGGYIGATQKSHDIDISENGGFVGGFSSYHIGQFAASGAITVGKLYNDIANKFGGDDFDNTWIGIGANATYDILIDPTFTIQPGLYAGYTWVMSSDFTAPGNIDVKNDDLNAFEIAPSMRAIKHIANGWFGAADAKYVVRLNDGGAAKIANGKSSELDTGNFTEYGISLEKAFGPFSATAHIHRRDGKRQGWNGSINIKYLF